jgi:hypothetical protein
MAARAVRAVKVDSVGLVVSPRPDRLVLQELAATVAPADWVALRATAVKARMPVPRP